MELEGIILSEICQTEKDILYELTYTWNLSKQTYGKKDQVCGGWERGNQRKVAKRYKLLVIR